MPDAAQADPYLRRLKRAFTAKVLGLTAALTLLSALSLAFASPQAFLAVLCPALLVLMVAGYALMLRSRAKVRTYKRERGWKAAGEQMTALVADESFPKPLSLWWCLLYVPVILLTLAIGLAGSGARPVSPWGSGLSCARRRGAIRHVRRPAPGPTACSPTPRASSSWEWGCLRA